MELNVSQGSAFTPSQGPHITQGHSCSSQLKWPTLARLPLPRGVLYALVCSLCLFVWRDVALAATTRVFASGFMR